MVPFAGYSMPIQYDGIMAEHVWTRGNAGLFDVSHMGQISLIGDNAAKALERIVPGAITTLTPGAMRYTLLLNDKGGILDDLMVTNAAKSLYLVVNGATKHDDIAYMQANLPDDVKLVHLKDEALLALQGPKAVAAFARLVPGVANMYFMQAGPFEWNGIPLGISRSGYTGEDGLEISVPAEYAQTLADALIAMDEVKPVGLGARDSLRLEAGLPLYGHDLSPDTLPVEANLSFALSKSRREAADYVGAKQVLAQYPDKAERMRVGLLIDGRQPVREGADVVDADGNIIGAVTSGGFSPSLERPIAMAYVPAALAATGSTILLRQRNKIISSTVTDMPFIPNGYHRRPKSA